MLHNTFCNSIKKLDRLLVTDEKIQCVHYFCSGEPTEVYKIYHSQDSVPFFNFEKSYNLCEILQSNLNVRVSRFRKEYLVFE